MASQVSNAHMALRQMLLQQHPVLNEILSLCCQALSSHVSWRAPHLEPRLSGRALGQVIANVNHLRHLKLDMNACGLTLAIKWW